ncbi:MAG TPA: hypothetical protein VNZ49_06510 [Bacteroidia bacterium]|jgi:hypothetical protein|nr:hypothetical protein [Bacteroidia bacterium]
MKKIFLILGVCLSFSTIAQTSACGQFHKTGCHMEGTKADRKAFQYNSQSKSGLFAQGTTSKLRCVVYKGMDYRMTVCCDAALGDKINFKIFDGRTQELLFDNTKNDGTKQFEFQAGSTRQLVIEVTVPTGEVKEEKGKPVDAACVGLLIEHKVSERTGFSQY